jgi:hypothetical protein
VLGEVLLYDMLEAAMVEVVRGPEAVAVIMLLLLGGLDAALLAENVLAYAVVREVKDGCATGCCVMVLWLLLLPLLE